MAGMNKRRVELFNAFLTAVLLVAIALAGNQLARRHLVLRKDLSQDQLYAISDATRSILARLEDRLSVKAYFSGDIFSGEAAIAKARLEAQLEECEALAGGHMEVTSVDPNRYSEVLREAQSYGIAAQEIESFQGASRRRESIYLGLLLRYRSREEVLPFVHPFAFESLFASRVHALISDRRVVVGWLGSEEPPQEDGEGSFGTFGRARGLLGRGREVRPVEYLEVGEPVDADIDVLFVVRPRKLHPRAVFELEQYVQRGGRLVLLLDDVTFHSRTGQSRLEPSGLEGLLQHWGVRTTRGHVWDDPWKGQLILPRVVTLSDGQQGVRGFPLDYPPFVVPRATGFAQEVLATSGLSQALFPWVHAIRSDEPCPEGVTRTTLIESSPDAYVIDPVETLADDPAVIQGQSDALYAQGTRDSGPFPLAVALSGSFPSPFAERGAPAAWDPAEPEARGVDEGTPVLSRHAAAQVVVIGDADWLRDPDLLFRSFFSEPNAVLLQNLVDWLSLDDELVSLRSRAPRDRSLRDFLDEARRAGGLLGPVVDTAEELEQLTRREDAAQRSARHRQYLAMALPIGISLALVLGFGLVWNLLERRRPLARGSSADAKEVRP